ncbi:hypothetical protein B0T18DRAFT_470066 [Schizothecium vesticola]|uniref:Uncharacterized protein n=1 Tax=Schizothecium vesticola TaxID=314040 RepID=A0AA40ERC9_9PEZI|nr:hypothetical protein B0T18DRAFT_470066 [Schizothecium vesticola]
MGRVAQAFRHSPSWMTPARSSQLLKSHSSSILPSAIPLALHGPWPSSRYTQPACHWSPPHRDAAASTLPECAQSAPPISTATNLFGVPSTHRRPARTTAQRNPSSTAVSRPGNDLAVPSRGWIAAGGHWSTVRRSARQRTPMQRVPCGWENAHRRPALDEPFASGVRLSWLSRSESSLAEPSAHASSPIHTKDIPTISLCRRLRRCSSEKQDLWSLWASSSKHNGAASLETSTFPRLTAHGETPILQAAHAGLSSLWRHVQAIGQHLWRHSGTGRYLQDTTSTLALNSCISATARGHFMAHSSCQTPETKSRDKPSLRRSNWMLAARHTNTKGSCRCDDSSSPTIRGADRHDRDLYPVTESLVPKSVDDELYPEVLETKGYTEALASRGTETVSLLSDSAVPASIEAPGWMGRPWSQKDSPGIHYDSQHDDLFSPSLSLFRRGF